MQSKRKCTNCDGHGEIPTCNLCGKELENCKCEESDFYLKACKVCNESGLMPAHIDTKDEY